MPSSPCPFIWTTAAPVLFPAHLGPSSPGQVAHTVPSDAPTTAEQSMQLGHARLIPEEHHRRIGAGEGLYCGQPGVLPLQALVNFGAQDSLLNQELVVQAGCVLEPVPSPYTATALDSGSSPGSLTRRFLSCSSPRNHSEPISFLVIPASRTPMVLDYSWLHRHNPRSTGYWAKW